MEDKIKKIKDEIQRIECVYTNKLCRLEVGSTQRVKLEGAREALKSIERYIDGLGYKTIKIEDYIKDYFKDWNDYEGCDSHVTNQFCEIVTLDDIKDVCRHFYEL